MTHLKLISGIFWQPLNRYRLLVLVYLGWIPSIFPVFSVPRYFIFDLFIWKHTSRSAKKCYIFFDYSWIFMIFSTSCYEALDSRYHLFYRFYRGWNLRRSTQNQINLHQKVSQNHRMVINSNVPNFHEKTPTYIRATYAITIFYQNFEERILRELAQNFYIMRFSITYWIK